MNTPFLPYDKDNNAAEITVEFGEMLDKEQLEIFCPNFDESLYNEIVVTNYAKVRMTQVLSLLGPLASLFVMIYGILEQNKLQPQQVVGAHVYSTAFLFGPILLLVSTGTYISICRFLRCQLVEQLEDFCVQQSHDLSDDYSVDLVQRDHDGVYEIRIIRNAKKDIEVGLKPLSATDSAPQADFVKIL